MHPRVALGLGGRHLRVMAAESKERESVSEALASHINRNEREIRE
jgi:hypothetical protein